MYGSIPNDVVRLCSKYVTMSSSKMLPHFKRDATLPCEIIDTFFTNNNQLLGLHEYLEA